MPLAIDAPEEAGADERVAGGRLQTPCVPYDTKQAGAALEVGQMAVLSPRFFNTAGPCRAGHHYLLPPGRRLPELSRLVREEQYFVLHAARQTGKTTAMRAFAEELRAVGTVALHVSLETSRGRPRIDEAETAWIDALRRQAGLTLPPAEQPPEPDPREGVGARWSSVLTRWCVSVRPRPVVLLLDEVDTIEGDAMVSFLAQLRAGFNDRPHGFPSSIALVGMRDLRDYLVAAKGGMPPGAGSPFNIKAKSLTLANFTRDEVAELYAQHTADTGQAFADDAVERAWYWTEGQPFLVNALAYHVTRDEPVPLSEPVRAPHIEAAKEALVRSRTTHLDNLLHRLHEPRVARVVRPVLLGDTAPADAQDDLDYARDLGLLAPSAGGLRAANPLYQEFLARALATPHQDSLAAPWWPWRAPGGGLDVPRLVDNFLGWWREHGDLLVDGQGELWREAAAHLAFMGFVQRVVNGGGEIRREYASGRGRLDLLVSFEHQRTVFELKRVHPKTTLETVRRSGIDQLVGYLDQLGLDEGWMLVFDQRPGRTWEERLWREDVEVGGKRLHLRGG